ncbi:isochorismate synthase [Azorhizophilus paspali]|uniref:isochorismate synthase n=1 Tax=Azorhizophilus paspali TaxID=69963 RepID=A0ABV6SH64_AZOPA
MSFVQQTQLAQSFSEPCGPQVLFTHYHRDACMFASPGQTLLAHGVAATLPLVMSGSPAALAGHAAAFLRKASEAGHAGWLIGAIPFLPGAAAHLFIPEHVELAGGGRAALIGGPRPVRTVAARSEPAEAVYEQNVSRALKRIADGKLRKVVLSRSLHIQAELDQVELLRTLAGRNPLGYTYAIPLPTANGGRRSLVGASPELLLARRGNRVISNPLAGSIPHSSDPAEDRQRAENLLRSPKDLHEHALVVEAVAEALRPYCTDLVVPEAPSLLSTPTMWHLSTEVTGTLRDPATTSLELALALHPTPAVGGYPTAEAREFIEEFEGFDRGFFTGLVGWCNAQGDGEWAVTIRCAEVGEQSSILYAGAGIVAGSEPALELAETAAKLRTMLGAMGLALAEENRA